MSDPKLNLEVQTSIVVTMPGTNFKVAFEKLSAELMMDDKDVCLTAWEAGMRLSAILGSCSW
jgi:hypothetical protein